jgi:hypothetical protein
MNQLVLNLIQELIDTQQLHKLSPKQLVKLIEEVVRHSTYKQKTSLAAR